MTDLEMIAAWRDAVNKAGAAMALGNDDEFAIVDRVSAFAETGALLAEVEAKWPALEYGVEYTRWYNTGSYVVRVVWKWDGFDTGNPLAQGSGPTLTAALRDLLGVDGG